MLYLYSPVLDISIIDFGFLQVVIGMMKHDSVCLKSYFHYFFFLFLFFLNLPPKICCERERDVKEKHPFVASHILPTQEQNHQPKYVLWLGIVYQRVLQPTELPCQGTFILVNIVIYYLESEVNFSTESSLCSSLISQEK